MHRFQMMLICSYQCGSGGNVKHIVVGDKKELLTEIGPIKNTNKQLLGYFEVA